MSNKFNKYEIYRGYHWVGYPQAPFCTYDPELAANYQVAAKAFREAAKGLVSGCVLDAGCGDGVMTATLLEVDHEVQVICLDADPTGIVLARQELGRRVRRPPSLAQGMCERLPFNTRSFTAVMAIEVIEHLERPETFLQEAYRVLKDNGILVLTTPPAGRSGYSS
jgi:ubiquinone/menaquinone biosynthesis C-methylase UbiE